MQENIVSNMSKEVINLFTKGVVNLDKAVKFVKRKSKLGACLFVETLVSGFLLDPTISLEGLCKLMKEQGIIISKQGLQQRFNSDEAVLLIKNFFLEITKLFKGKNSNVFDLLKSFSTVSIIDSSGVSLPTNLKNLYKGSGGSASEAALKIQVFFDYTQGQIKQLEITEGCRSDQGYTKHLGKIEKGALHLQDLGYFALKSFKEIHEHGAYFISRYSITTNLFDEQGKSIDLINELQKSKGIFEKQVYIGEKERFKVRLVACRLSEEQSQQRIRKAKRTAQRKGKQLTKKALKFIRWSIYITNVPKDMIPTEHVHLVYTLRWQIELFFKLCKSGAGVDKISGKKINRILCEIYAKLTCITMLLYFCSPLRWQESCELSFFKAYKVLMQRALDFFRALKSLYRFIKFMKVFFSDLKDFAYKDGHRIKNLLMFQKLMNAGGQRVLVCK